MKGTIKGLQSSIDKQKSTWVLLFVGIDPAYQNKKLGAMLLQPGIWHSTSNPFSFGLGR